MYARHAGRTMLGVFLQELIEGRDRRPERAGFVGLFAQVEGLVAGLPPHDEQ